MARYILTTTTRRVGGSKMTQKVKETSAPDFSVSAALPLALVTTGAVGWKTVRKRWEQDLAALNPVMRHIEDYSRTVSSFCERFGAKSVGHALAGRAACASALDAGARIVLMNTLQNAPFAPLRPGVRYIVYGDCTTSQLAQLYGGKTLGFPGSKVTRGLQNLVAHGAIFLCASDWYRRALREELNVAEDRLMLAPLYVDTEMWRPLPEKRNERPQILFIGGDLARKGGDIVYKLAAAFPQADFHIVSPQATHRADNVHLHCDMTPDCEKLRALVATCDLYIQPTRADMSSLAAMEAAACGLPAIITGVGAIPEIVRDGETGAVLAAAEYELFRAALAEHLQDPALVKTRGEAARRHIEQNFSKAQHMTALSAALARASADALQEVAGPSAPARGAADAAA